MPEPTSIAPPFPTLGERCVAWCLAEKARELRPSTETLVVWFANVVRNGRPLGLKISDDNRPNHCAAAQSNAALSCKLPHETIPHGSRAAAKELMADAYNRAAWHSKAEILAGWRPRVGDLAIYDRSNPAKPETSWYGHVDRVTRVMADAYENIGANEGPHGEWVIGVTRFDAPRLLGFISYPTNEPDQPETADELSDEDKAHAVSIVGLTLAEARWWEDESIIPESASTAADTDPSPPPIPEGHPV